MYILDLLAPELIVTVGAVVVLVIGTAGRGAWRTASGWLALATLVGAFITAAYRPLPEGVSLPGIEVTWLAWVTRLVGLGVSILLLLVAWHVPESGDRGEFFAMLLFSVLGVLLVGLASDLIVLFLALELVSVPTYVLVAVGRRHLHAQEAGVKYFFLGAVSAAMMVYGFSFLFGLAGSTDLGAVADAIGQRGMDDPLVVVGLTLSIAGLAFKIAAVPLHGYAADVYQGAAAPVTGMLGFLPKLAGMVALVTLVNATGWRLEGPLYWLLWIMSAATMTTGNVLALLQRNVKRTLAYSSIAHSGYMLMALLVGPVLGESIRDGVTALFFYITVYGVMNLGAFAVLAYVRVGDREAEDLDDVAGLATRDGVAALVMAICMFSLMGMPPTGGFLAKVGLFGSVFAAGGTAMIVLAVIGLVNAAIGAAYYLRIAGACYLREPVGHASLVPAFSLRVGMALCCLIVLALGIGPNNLLRCVSQASRDLRRSSRASLVQYAPGADGADGAIVPGRSADH